MAFVEFSCCILMLCRFLLISFVLHLLAGRTSLISYLNHPGRSRKTPYMAVENKARRSPYDVPTAYFSDAVIGNPLISYSTHIYITGK